MPNYGGVQITCNPGIFSGRPIINGHRVTVHDVVVYYQAGMSLNELASGYNLRPDEIAAALAYYEDHQAEIDQQIAADQRDFDRRASADTSPVAQRMRQIGKSFKFRSTR